MKIQIITIAALTCSLLMVSAEENLIKNGDFATKSLKPWKVFAVRSTKKAEVVVKDGVLSLTMKYGTGKATRRQLSQTIPDIKSNSRYKLTFEAKASRLPSELTVTLGRSKDWDKGHYGFLREVELGAEWTTHTIYFKTKKIEEDNFTPEQKTMWLDKIGQNVFEKEKLFLPQFLLSMKKARVCLAQADDWIQANICVENVVQLKAQLTKDRENNIELWKGEEKEKILNAFDENISLLESRMKCIRSAQNITDLSSCMK